MTTAMHLWFLLLGTSLLTKSTTAQAWVEEIKSIWEKKLDPEWRDYVDSLAGEYEEIQEPEAEELKPPPFTNFGKDWNPTSPSETAFLAVIYRRDVGASRDYKRWFPNEPDPGYSHVEPGTACGGAIITPNHVLTMCGCVYTVLVGILGPPAVFPSTLLSDIQATPLLFDINFLRQSIDQLPQLYVANVMTHFRPDFTHQFEPGYMPRCEVHLDKLRWWNYTRLTCQLLREEIDIHHRHKNNPTKAALLNGEIVVLPFEPAIIPDEPEFFSQWPPIPITSDTDREYKAHAKLVSIGMRQHRTSKLKFYNSYAAATTQMQHCNKKNTYVCDSRKLHIGIKFECFCPLVREYGLVGGTIGWPVVNKDGVLIGLTASERSSADGTILVATLNADVITLINQYIGKDLLESQNTPPPVYRGHDIPQHLNVYDYNFPRPRFFQDIQSRASSVMCSMFGPTAALVVFLAWKTLSTDDLGTT